jgi:hypothetical protein
MRSRAGCGRRSVRKGSRRRNRLLSRHALPGPVQHAAGPALGRRDAPAVRARHVAGTALADHDALAARTQHAAGSALGGRDALAGPGQDVPGWTWGWRGLRLRRRSKCPRIIVDDRHQRLVVDLGRPLLRRVIVVTDPERGFEPVVHVAIFGGVRCTRCAHDDGQNAKSDEPRRQESKHAAPRHTDVKAAAFCAFKLRKSTNTHRAAPDRPRKRDIR